MFSSYHFGLILYSTRSRGKDVFSRTVHGPKGPVLMFSIYSILRVASLRKKRKKGIFQVVPRPFNCTPVVISNLLLFKLFTLVNSNSFSRVRQ